MADRPRVIGAVRTSLRSVGHSQQLTLVDHLDELRTRLLVSLVVIGVAFGLCFWQNGRLLQVMNAPLAHQTTEQIRHGNGPLGQAYATQRSARDLAVQLRLLVGVISTQPTSGQDRAALSQIGTSVNNDIKRLSAPPQGDRPITLGLGEPFTTTVTVSLIFALILSLPILLLQAYNFLAPALDPLARRRMRPLLVAIPALFVAGVMFGYFIVLPAAIHFLQSFNSNQFDVLVQASPYYSFAAKLLLTMGLVFEVPVLVVAVTQSGTLGTPQLRRGRRYAIAASAAVGAFLPGDALTMLLETVPLYLLFELGIAISALLERRRRASAARALRTAEQVGA
ncbi:MAG TPA: twin-arginine translocase subunit TatC [Solirubrobacteraceae bacterium]|nr:twin-arginine translocase subunit TatC [Solirubrobacteraceae bacterium]